MQADIRTLTAGTVAATMSAAFGMGLWLSLAKVQFLIFVFAFGSLVSLPVLITIFSYGTNAGIFSAILATFFLVAGLPSVAALLIALFFFIPSVFVGWLMDLARTDRQKGVLLWYPLCPALFQLALVITIAAITLMLYLLSSAEVMQYIDGLINQFTAVIRDSNLYRTTDQTVIEKTLRIRFIPAMASVFAVYGFLFHLGSLYLSMRLAKKLGYLRRPPDDWPAALRMPPAAFFIFSAGWIMSLFPFNDTLVICMDAIVSVLGASFFASGLAFIHQATRGRSWRLSVLVAVYSGLFTLVLTPFIIMALVLTGLFATTFSSHRNDTTRRSH